MFLTRTPESNDPLHSRQVTRKWYVENRGLRKSFCPLFANSSHCHLPGAAVPGDVILSTTYSYSVIFATAVYLSVVWIGLPLVPSTLSRVVVYSQCLSSVNEVWLLYVGGFVTWSDRIQSSIFLVLCNTVFTWRRVLFVFLLNFVIFHYYSWSTIFYF